MSWNWKNIVEMMNCCCYGVDAETPFCSDQSISPPPIEIPTATSQFNSIQYTYRSKLKTVTLYILTAQLTLG